jgi:hypothetical protein
MTTRPLLAVLLAACSSHLGATAPDSVDGSSSIDAAMATGHVQMNDLSVLFPLPTPPELATALAASAPARGGQLLPEAIYDQVLGLETLPYAQLRVVAFRLDPCFGHLGPVTDPSTCQAQLRLVFQRLANIDGHVLATDSAVHAFYTLDADQVAEAVRMVIAARVTNGGDADLGSLAVHPIVSAQGLSGPMGTRLTSIVTKYAGAANFIRFTTFLAGNPSATPPGVAEDWLFEGFDVTSGTISPMAIATVAGQVTFAAVHIDSTTPLSTGFSNVTTSPDNLALLTKQTKAVQATSAARQAAFDAALRIENPGFHSPNTIDCASCHMAQPARQLVGEKVLGLTEPGNANLFIPDPAIPISDLHSMTAVVGSDGGLNLHAFSYRSGEPMINARVVHETAANLAYFASLGL